MTMAAGFRCKDGVVLCADTEMTIPGWLKYPGSKIRRYGKIKCRPVFTFAGDQHFCEMFMSKLVKRILWAQVENGSTLAAIEDEALLVHRTFSGEQYEAESALIVSLWQGPEGGEQRDLFEVFQGVVNQVSRSCQGTGVPVTQSMITELFSPDMSMKQAALLATYMLAEAKAYGYGVGKDSQIILLFHKGSWAPFPEDPFYSSVKEIEDDYIYLKNLLKPIISAYSDIGIDGKGFSKILGDFGEYAAQRRQKRRSAYEALIQQELESQAEDVRAFYEDIPSTESDESNGKED